MPIYSIDREEIDGFPKQAIKFIEHVSTSDAIIISFAEHNGSYTAAFKNIFDWISRLEKPTWSDKPMLLLATSLGGRGAQTVLDTAKNSFPHQGGQVIASFSLPSFYKNFNEGQGIIDDSLKKQFLLEITNFRSTY